MRRVLYGSAATVLLCGAAYWLTLLHIALSRPLIDLETLISGTAPLPFQRRILVPFLIGLTHRWFGVSLASASFVWEWAAWIALVLAGCWAVSALWPAVPPRWRILAAATVTAPVLTHLVLPTRFRLLEDERVVGDVTRLGASTFQKIASAPNLFYPWDTPSAVFMLALVVLAFLVRERRSTGALAAYAVTFVIAACNRETVALLVPLAAIAWYGRLRPLTYGVMLAVQVLALVALEVGIRVLLDPPPNARGALVAGAYEWQLKANLRTLAEPRYAAVLVPAFGAGMWAPVALGWRCLDHYWRLVVAMVVLPSIAAAVGFGLVLEYRVFVDISPVVWLTSVAAVHGALVRAEPAESTGAFDAKQPSTG